MVRLAWVLLFFHLQAAAEKPFQPNGPLTKDTIAATSKEAFDFYIKQGMSAEKAQTAAKEWLSEAEKGCVAEPSPISDGAPSAPRGKGKDSFVTEPSATAPETCKTLDKEIVEQGKSGIENAAKEYASSNPLPEPPKPTPVVPTPAQPSPVLPSPASPPPKTAGPTAPPSYGPLSPRPEGPMVVEAEQTHTGNTTPSSYESSNSVSKTSGTTESRTVSISSFNPTPAVVANNFSVAKDALDERVARGTLSPVVAEALLARLKPVLETEPNLIKALGNVQESLKEKTLFADPVPVAENRSQSSLTERPPSDVKAAGLPLPRSFNSSSAPEGSPLKAVNAAALLVASAALLESTVALSKPAGKEALAPSKISSGKTDPGVLAKSAGVLSSTATVSYFPPLPSKAFSAKDERVPSKPTKPKIGGILAKILTLFTGPSKSESTKARAISSLTGKHEEGSGDATLASLNEPEVDFGDDGFDQEFLAIGLGAFGISFGAALLTFVLWSRKRSKKKTV